MKLYKIILLTLLGLVVAAWIVISQTIPDNFLKTRLETELSDMMQAKVTVETVTLNPATFELTIQGVSMPHPEASGLSQPLLSFKELRLAPDFSPLWQFKLPLATATLIEPKVDITYMGDGNFSFSHLLPDKTAVDSGQRVSIFWLSNFKLVNGQLTLRQGFSRQEIASQLHQAITSKATASQATAPQATTSQATAPQATASQATASQATAPQATASQATAPEPYEITEINFEVPLDASSKSLQPTLTAKLEGSSIEIQGEVQTLQDQVITGFKLQTDPLPLQALKEYLEESTPLQLASGSFDLDLNLNISQPQRGRVELALSGIINLHDLEMLNERKVSIAKLRYGKFAISNFTLHKRQIVMREVELNGLFLQATRLKSGEIDWSQWVNPVDLEAPPEEDFSIEGAKLSLRNTDFRLINEPSGSQSYIEITGLDGIIDNFSTKPKVSSSLSLSFGISNEGVLILKGMGSLNPLDMQADLKVQDLPLIFLRPLLTGTPLIDMLGRMDFNGHFSLSPDNLLLKEAGGAVRELSFARHKNSRTMSLKSTGNPALSLSNLQFSGLNLNLKEQSFTVQGLNLQKPYARLNITAENMLPDVADWPKPGSAAASNAAKVLNKAATLGGWSFNINELKVKEGRLEKAAQPTPEIMVHNLNLTSKKISSDLSKSISLTAFSQGQEAQSMEMQGLITPKPLKAKIKLKGKDIDLKILSFFTLPWLNLAYQGRAIFDWDMDLQSTKPLDLKAKGNLTLRDFQLMPRPIGEAILSNASVGNDGNANTSAMATASAAKATATKHTETTANPNTATANGTTSTANQQLIRLRRLGLTNFTLDTNTTSLAVPSLIFDSLHLNLRVNDQGQVNLWQMLRGNADLQTSSSTQASTSTSTASVANPTEATSSNPTEATSSNPTEATSSNPTEATSSNPTEATSSNPTEATSSAAPPTPKPNPWLRNLEIADLTIQNSSLSFRDARTMPPASLGLRSLNAKIQGFAMQTMSSIKLSAILEGAPLELQGSISLLQEPMQLDLALSLKGLDLISFSPYSLKYTAYPITQGMLNLDSNIKTIGKQFEAQNALVLEKITLGPKDPQIKAPDYPLALGISLLTDRNGQMKLDLPITGELADLNFKTGNIIGKAFGGLFGKILTSPLSLVTGIFSLLSPSDPKLQAVAFNPGQARVRSNAMQALEILGKSLNEHPKLQLTLLGKYEPQSDLQGLARRKVHDQVIAAYNNSLSPSELATKTGQLPAGSYEAWLTKLYQTSFNTKDASNEPDIMEEELASLVNVSGDDLQRLAQDRAKAVQTALVEFAPEAVDRIKIAPFNDLNMGLAQVEIQVR